MILLKNENKSQKCDSALSTLFNSPNQAEREREREKKRRFLPDLNKFSDKSSGSRTLDHSRNQKSIFKLKFCRVFFFLV